MSQADPPAPIDAAVTDATAIGATTKDKAFVYLLRGGRDLLLLTHPDHPAAGIQVPAGTIEAGETPAAAALRELREETGLSRVRLTAFLGRTLFDLRPFGRAEIHRRHFFAARLEGMAPERWSHVEQHADYGEVRFDLFWWPLSAGAPNLIAEHGALLDRVAARG